MYLVISFFLLLSLPLTVEAGSDRLDFSVQPFPGEEGVKISLRLHNESDHEKTLTFQTSQAFDYYIKNDQGNVVYQYSRDKSFLQALQSLRLKRGEEKVWTEKWDYIQNGHRVPTGRYTIEALLLGEDLSGFDHPLRAVGSFNVPVENGSFRSVGVKEIKGRFVVTGKARVADGSFYYSVEDGHEVLLKESLMKVNKEAPYWTGFSIVLPELKGSGERMFLHLYERDDGDGKVVNLYVVPITK